MFLLDSVNDRPVNVDQVGTFQLKAIGGGNYRVAAVSAEGTEMGQFEVDAPMNATAAEALLIKIKTLIGMTSLNVLYPS